MSFLSATERICFRADKIFTYSARNSPQDLSVIEYVSEVTSARLAEAYVDFCK